MPDSIMYHEGNRRLQDQFDSRRISDRLEEKLTRTAFTADDKAFIESVIYFFIATADADGRPDCSFKGGAPGFVRVTAPDELAFPDYDGNGMFKSLGNLLVNPNVGLLFIDMHEKPRRLRVNGQATVSRDDPLLAHTVGAQLIVRVKARAIFPNCPRYIPKLQLAEPSQYVPQPGAGPGRAGLEGLRRLQGLRAPAPADVQGRERQRLRARWTPARSLSRFSPPPWPWRASCCSRCSRCSASTSCRGSAAARRPGSFACCSSSRRCWRAMRMPTPSRCRCPCRARRRCRSPSWWRACCCCRSRRRTAGSRGTWTIRPGASWRCSPLTVGVPYVVLATTTPLLSRWLARIEPGLDPARFYAASNLGSFAGLISYPFVFERAMSSGQQTRWWSWAYALYAVLFSFCAFLALRRARGDTSGSTRALLRATGSGDPLLLWIGLAALGSILLLATTNAISQWSAVVPFLWILPLSVYLLTFVLAFGYPRLYVRTLFGVAFLLLAGATFSAAQPATSADLLIQLLLNAATLVVGCTICHAELVKLQPAPDRAAEVLPGNCRGRGIGRRARGADRAHRLQRLLRAPARAVRRWQ